MVLDFKVNARLVVGMTINFFLPISEGEDSFFFRALQRSSTSAPQRTSFAPMEDNRQSRDGNELRAALICYTAK